MGGKGPILEYIREEHERFCVDILPCRVDSEFETEREVERENEIDLKEKSLYRKSEKI